MRVPFIASIGLIAGQEGFVSDERNGLPGKNLIIIFYIEIDNEQSNNSPLSLFNNWLN